MKIRVECYAGHRGEETPRRIVLGQETASGRQVDVCAVLDAWLAPDHRYFKVKGDDGAVYILRHSADRGWELVMMDRQSES